MNSITLHPIKSSQIAAIGHDPLTHTLAVQFKNGGTYHYHGVAAEKFEALKSAESAGKFLGQHIKPHHAFIKVSA